MVKIQLDLGVLPRYLVKTQCPWKISPPQCQHWVQPTAHGVGAALGATELPVVHISPVVPTLVLPENRCQLIRYINMHRYKKLKH